MDDKHPVLAVCTKCGRKFITANSGTWTDGYSRLDRPIRMKDLPTSEVCGGKVELTDAGRAALATGPSDNTAQEG